MSGVIVLPQRFTSQPQYSPPIVSGYSDVVFSLIGNSLVDRKTRAYPTGTIGTTIAMPKGIAYVLPASSTTWVRAEPDLDPMLGGSFSVNWYGSLRADTGQLLLSYAAGYGWSFNTGSWAGGYLRFSIYNIWRGTGYLTGATYVGDDLFHSVSLTYDDPSATAEIFLDGVSIGSGTFTKDPGTVSSGSIAMSGHATLPHKMLAVQAYRGVLSRARILALSQNPWILFKAPSRRIYSIPAGGGTKQTYIKVAGVWKPATVWIKVGGVWKTSTPYINVSGTWKPLT